jgi:hypothetical protein
MVDTGALCRPSISVCQWFLAWIALLKAYRGSHMYSGFMSKAMYNMELRRTLADDEELLMKRLLQRTMVDSHAP